MILRDAPVAKIEYFKLVKHHLQDSPVWVGMGPYHKPLATGGMISGPIFGFTRHGDLFVTWVV